MKYKVYEWGGVDLREHECENYLANPDGFFDLGITNCDSHPTNVNNALVREPVIYIENLENKEIHLQVDIHPHGKITETLPKYEKIGDWKITVNKDNVINDIFNYLFYEVDINLVEDIKCNSYRYYKETIYSALKQLFKDEGFKEIHFNDFINYWAKTIDKYENEINFTIFNKNMINKYFHTVFSPYPPISWKRLYIAFW